MTGDLRLLQSIRELIPENRRLARGAWLAVALWLVFLVLTAYSSAATLLSRVQSTDVMKAATGGVWQGRVTFEVVVFLLTQIGLHLFFAAITWCLALLTALSFDASRQRFGRMVVAWFCALAGAALAFSALWYPRTLFGAYYHDAMAAQVGPWPLGQLIYVGVAVLCVVTVLGAAMVIGRRTDGRRFLRTALAGSAALLLIGLVVSWPKGRSGEAHAGTDSDRPHVIILGIDSLRLEQLRRYGGQGATPNLDRFLADADLFRDTTTPAARTFSSWSAILTGRAPTQTGVRFNLAARSSLRVNPTLADVLRESGYRTIYSTDEVRFANIDETFGFDQVVTPRIGASDFVIGTYNELPLASMFINSPIGEWLFPFSYANRGVATMFQPRTFVDRLDRAVSFDRPTLFISHLTAAHWPYYTGDTPFGIPARTPDDGRPLYQAGLQTADRMFGEVVAMLERKGALRNAIVIVLSDHGEAMGLASDQFFDSTFFVEGLRAPLRMLAYGHGQSVLSKSQYQVLLGFKTYGSSTPASAGRDFTLPVTVEDIAPTILEALGVPTAPLQSSGRSLWTALRTGTGAEPLEDRVRFTETDLAVLPGPAGGVDEVGTARKNSVFFEINPANGRLQIRSAYAPLAVAYKERAAFSGDKLLAAIPAGPYAHQYIYFDFGGHRGQLLLAKPGDELPQARRLWEALETHYTGELKEPVAITREDWDRIASEWENFLVHDRDAGEGRRSGT
jgi:hypothetical protein